jgi:hypothetical protein
MSIVVLPTDVVGVLWWNHLTCVKGSSYIAPLCTFPVWEHVAHQQPTSDNREIAAMGLQIGRVWLQSLDSKHLARRRRSKSTESSWNFASLILPQQKRAELTELQVGVCGVLSFFLVASFNSEHFVELMLMIVTCHFDFHLFLCWSLVADRSYFSTFCIQSSIIIKTNLEHSFGITLQQ